MGARRWRIRAVGRGVAAVSPPHRRIRRGRFVGDRRSQVAERAVTTAASRWSATAPRCGRPWRSSAAYFTPARMREPSSYTPEMSRRARGVELWAALRSLGRDGLADLIERTCRHAQRFADGLRARGYEILNDVVINQVLVSFGRPAVTRAVIATCSRTARAGAAAPSGTGAPPCGSACRPGPRQPRTCEHEPAAIDRAMTATREPGGRRL